MAAFLVQKAELWVMLFELLQACQGLVDSVEASLVGGDEVQPITVARRSGRKSFGYGESFTVLAIPA
jgi:hypothetical protein